MQIIICYLVVFLAEAFIIKQYCSTLFVSKHSIRTEILILVILYGTLFGISFMKNPLLNTASFFAANFVFLLFSCDIKWSTGFFHAIITTIAMGLSELIVAGILSKFITNFYDSEIYLKNSITFLLTSKPFYFLFLYGISHLLIKTPKNYERNSTKEIVLFSIIPLISFWIDLTFLSVFRYTAFPPAVSYMITASSILLLMANFIIYAIYTYSGEKNRRFTDLQLQLQKEHDSVSYYKMLLSRDETQNILIHDIKKHLQAIALLNEQGDRGKIASYIDQLAGSPDLQAASRICDHEFLNAILCRYKHDCLEQHIDFYTDIRSGTLNYVTENDLTSLFCNLLDNAREAAEKTVSASIRLVVTHMPQAELTVITVVNSCRTNPFQKNGKLISTRKDSARHGFGLKSVERIVLRYNGNMELYYDEEERMFHAVITLKSDSRQISDLPPAYKRRI